MQVVLTIFVALTSFAANTMAQIINFRGYASSVSCSGDAFGCSDGGAVCCSLPTGFGFSAQFDNLPAGTQGQGYIGSGCTDFLFSVFGPGTKCWNGGGARATHLNWFHSPQRRDENASDSNCVEPTFFEYKDDAHGSIRAIKVPAEKGSAQKIANLHIAKNYSALATYEDY